MSIDIHNKDIRSILYISSAEKAYRELLLHRASVRSPSPGELLFVDAMVEDMRYWDFQLCYVQILSSFFFQKRISEIHGIVTSKFQGILKQIEN